MPTIWGILEFRTLSPNNRTINKAKLVSIRKKTIREAYRIPASSSFVSIFVAAEFSAFVISRSNVGKNGGIRGICLINEWRDEAQGGLVVIHSIRVEEGDDGSPYWRRAGCTNKV